MMDSSRAIRQAMVHLKCLFIWIAMDALVTSAESTNKLVNCAACQVMSSHSSWECDVKCITAPEGTLIYGQLIIHNLKSNVDGTSSLWKWNFTPFLFYISNTENCPSLYNIPFSGILYTKYSVYRKRRKEGVKVNMLPALATSEWEIS